MAHHDRFDPDRFVEDCRRALADASPRHAVHEVVARAVADPAGIDAALGEPERPGLHPLHAGPDLTVIRVVWGPRMVLRPHDHTMWAVNGIYSGREDNTLWRRVPDDLDGRIEAAGALSLGPGRATVFGVEAVHSVVNPLDRLTGALHVYGGDFFHREGSEWSPEDLGRRPLDIDRIRAEFERSARLMDLMAAAPAA